MVPILPFLDPPKEQNPVDDRKQGGWNYQPLRCFQVKLDVADKSQVDSPRCYPKEQRQAEILRAVEPGTLPDRSRPVEQHQD